MSSASPLCMVRPGVLFYPTILLRGCQNRAIATGRRSGPGEGSTTEKAWHRKKGIESRTRSEILCLCPGRTYDRVYERARFVLGRGCKPRSQRYSFSPRRLPTQRDSTKNRSLKRFTYLRVQGLIVSSRESARMSRSARRQSVRHWCKNPPIRPPPGKIKDLSGSSSF